MKRTADCLVIGGGIIGMLTARELAAAGREVMIVDKGHLGGESTWAGGGILSPLYPWRYPAPVTALASWGQRHYPSLIDTLRETTGIDPQWEPSGLLILDTDEAAEALQWARAHGRGLVQIDRAKLQRLEPGLGPRAERALWMPQVAHVRNPRLIKALRRALVVMGVRLCEGVSVNKLLCVGDRARGARTSAGCISAPQVVVAGGAWSASLVTGLGLETGIEPVRGQMLLFAARPGVVRRIVMQDGCYLIPRRDGHVLAGSTVEYVGFDKSVTRAARLSLHEAALNLVPALGGFPVEAHWAGLRPGNRDGLPLIGAVPGMEGLYINSGHFRNGVVLGPGSARMLAQIMGGQPVSVADPDPFRPARSCVPA